MTSWKTVPEDRKNFALFLYLCFSGGVHFTAFGVLEHVMNTASICIAETQNFSCVLFTFCIMSLNFH